MTESSTTTLDAASLHSEGGRGDRTFTGLARVAGFLVLAVLGLITYTMVSRSGDALRHMGLDFFTSRRWNPPARQYGILSYIYGTIFTAVIALTLSVPVSLGIALFMTQIATPRLKRWLGTVIDLLAVVPSVVFGLWGISVLALKIRPLYEWLDVHMGWLPFFAGPASGTGRTILTAGLVLAIIDRKSTRLNSSH